MRGEAPPASDAAKQKEKNRSPQWI
ncbi:hypothetical protein F01_440039 [Burkholderia cenocepacia]|nr:hypothetical protein F01_440039 [Burkholderia cenocepacia]